MTLSILDWINVIFLPLCGCFLGLLSYRRSVLEAIWQWTQIDSSKELVEARGFVQYKLQADYNPEDVRKDVEDMASKISPVINAYHHLGMLVRERYIPISIFKKTSSGQTIVFMYEKLLPYILKVREDVNPYYANNFQFLYDRIKKYYK